MTILFYDDWKSRPDAIIHETTTNRSFVRLASLYKKMGVRNYAFPLALHNRELEHVNPFSPHLSTRQILMIMEECLDNAWYFFREIARAPAKSSDIARMVEGNRANIALWWSFFNHITFLLVQPRQTGKSFCTDTMMSYLLNIACRNTNINLLTKNDQLRRENIQRIKDIFDELPGYLRFRDRSDVNNGEEITINKLGNHYKTNVPQSSEKLANNMGRGLTTPIIHIDEGPFQHHIGVAVTAMLSAMGNAKERAAAAGAPYGVIMTTTAGKKDDRDGGWFYKNVVQPSAPWSERFLDASGPKELEFMIRQMGDDVTMINGTFDHRQLGKDDAWLAKQIQDSLQKGEAADRDYLNIWTSGNESSPFDAIVTDKISKSIMQPLYQEITSYGYILRWHIEQDEITARMANCKTVLGVDTSEAGGRDDICLVCLDVETADILFTARFNVTNLITFADWLVELIVRFPNMTTIIERKSSGPTIIDNLTLKLPLHGHDPFKRLYNRIVQDQLESEYDRDKLREVRATPLARRDITFYNSRKTAFGFATSGGTGSTSRTNLYSTVLQTATRRSAEKIKDPILIQQILGLVNKDGRIDHSDGGHDDMVIAWLLAHWLLTQGKNLKDYGIDTRFVLTSVEAHKEYTAEEIAKLERQDQIREEIEKLVVKLEEEDDENVALRLEARLRYLDRIIELQDGENYSLDVVLSSIKEAKRAKARIASISNGLRDNAYHRQPTYGSYTRAPEHLQGFGAYQNLIS